MGVFSYIVSLIVRSTPLVSMVCPIDVKQVSFHSSGQNLAAMIRVEGGLGSPTEGSLKYNCWLVWFRVRVRVRVSDGRFFHYFFRIFIIFNERTSGGFYEKNHPLTPHFDGRTDGWADLFFAALPFFFKN